MLKVNPNYEKLPGSYLFAEIARRVKEYTQAHPDADVIRLGIGDVTRPLAPAVVEAFERRCGRWAAPRPSTAMAPITATIFW